VTRFAPAPTGHLHLGHVVNAIFVWRLAREHDRKVLLRIEDHDAQRCRPEFERSILDDLDWLGFQPDEFPTSAFRRGPCASRQSDRDALYREHAAVLVDRGLVYGCRCSRQQIAALSSDRDDAAQRYPGTCRSRGLAPTDGLTWRLRLDPGTEHFDDLLEGRQAQDPAAQCGDLVIRDRLGNWTYQFAVSVDDYRQGVDLVVRGRDLLDSTGRQMRLARLLGRGQPARFAHHALLMKSSTQKLSKADRDTGIRDLRARGWTPRDILDEAERQIAGRTG